MPSRGKAKVRMSLRALGRELNVSLTAVQKAIRSGRLRRSIGRDARGPYVVDVALAKREWRAGASKPANRGGSKPAPAPGNGKAAGGHARTLVEAQLRLATQRADALELANRRRRGELLDAATVEREQFQVARTLRERIFNVAERFADLGPVVVRRIRDELRQALGDVADELGRE